MSTHLLSDGERLARLGPPRGRVRMVLDTDTYNEIDDQFALVYALLSPEKLNVEAVYAAPFHNSRSTGPADGMEKSHEEIMRVLERMGRDDGADLAFRGSTAYLASKDAPVESPAALDLVERATASAGMNENPLYVVAIGAPTNVSSAILIEPEIVKRIVVVWLGGQPLHWPTAEEFNLRQDILASQVLFDSGVPLVRVPCSNVAEMLRTTVPEVERWVKGRGTIGDYLYSIFRDYCEARASPCARSKVIWDVAAVAWLVNADWVRTEIVHSPILTRELTRGPMWGRDGTRHLVREATHVDRDAIFRDLFEKLARS